MSCSSSKCSPCPSVLLLKRNQTPLYDIFGPYPDELIMTVLDRILYYAGATKIIQMVSGVTQSCAQSSSTPLVSCPPSSNSSLCSLFCPSTNTAKCSTSPSCCTTKPKTCRTASTESTCQKASLCLKCSPICSNGPSRRRTTRVDFANPVSMPGSCKRCCAGKSPQMDQMKHSLSMCSIACERLKSKLTTTVPKRVDGHKWLWTRLISQENGCKVYEVYKNSNMNTIPKLDGQKTPLIIFLVMPNGYIMPFETLTPTSD